MSETLQLGVLLSALLIVAGCWATAIVLSIKVKEPSDDLREVIKNLYWVGSFGATAFIGLAASAGGVS